MPAELVSNCSCSSSSSTLDSSVADPVPKKQDNTFLVIETAQVLAASGISGQPVPVLRGCAQAGHERLAHDKPAQDSPACVCIVSSGSNVIRFARSLGLGIGPKAAKTGKNQGQGQHPKSLCSSIQ